MLHRWSCLSPSGSYQNLTAHELRELAATRTIGPADSVGIGLLIPCYKYLGLFADAAFIEVNWRGGGDGSASPVTVSLNNRVIGTGHFGPGFCFWHEVRLGRHVAGAKLRFQSEKEYRIDARSPGIYCCDLLWEGGYWGNFHDTCDVYNQPARFHNETVLLQRWEEERRAAQCEFCSVEWAVEFVGEKVLHEQQQYKTITRTVMNWVENPDFYLPSPYFQPRHVQVPTEYQDQVVVIVSTVREYFRCGHCGKKWSHDCTREQVP